MEVLKNPLNFAFLRRLNSKHIVLRFVIDFGNTSAKIGLFDEDRLILVKREVKKKEIMELVRQYEPKSVMISSVSKKLEKFMVRLSTQAPLYLLDKNTQLPFANNYETPDTLGSDRLANAAGAQAKFPNKNNLIIDCGTCITYDFIDQNSEFHGGGISPGAILRLKALHNYTSRLPLVDLGVSEVPLIGRSTKKSILSGVINGTIAEIEGIVSRYKEKFDDLNIILSGGDAKFFESKLKAHIFAIPELVLMGLNHILKHNEEL